jgi:hypothetical protein
MQIVYLSARPDRLRETLIQVRRFMPFVDDVVACVPEHLRERFAATLPSDVRIVDDESVTSARRIAAEADHTKRNFLLRAAVVRSGLTAAQFILSDDDARPLRPLAADLFLENGRYHNYYFYDLCDWPWCRTDFDKGQQNTYAVLSYLDMPHLAYASHMPQVFDREFYLEVLGILGDLPHRHALCEWSTYFNIARERHPDRFHPPRPYRTLCWPDVAGTWLLQTPPSAFSFENFDPNLYGSGRLFDGLAPAPQPADADAVAMEKAIRWRQAWANRLDGHPLPSDPWRHKSFGHRLAIRLARPLQKVLRFALLREMEKIARIRPWRNE